MDEQTALQGMVSIGLKWHYVAIGIGGSYASIPVNLNPGYHVKETPIYGEVTISDFKAKIAPYFKFQAGKNYFSPSVGLYAGHASLNLGYYRFSNSYSFGDHGQGTVTAPYHPGAYSVGVGIEF